MDEDHLRRRMEKRREMKPKGLFEVMGKMTPAMLRPTTQGTLVENTTMKVQARRYAGRTLHIGRSNFKFDEDGICAFGFSGRSSTELADWKALCRTPGVVQLGSVTEDPPAPEPSEEPVQGSITVTPVVIPDDVSESSVVEETVVEVQDSSDEEKSDASAETEETPSDAPKVRRRRAKLNEQGE